MHPHRFRSGLVSLVLAAALCGCASAPQPAPAAAGANSLVVFLVRHAEKAPTGANPGLSAAGRVRAEVLAGLLRSAAIEHVHSTDFIRTRDTAAPTARAFGLPIEWYDPTDLAALATRLRQGGGRHLVVGHSNTTPQLVGLLGGDPGPAIDETAEYDRLYVVTIGDRGTAQSVVIRYPAPGDHGGAEVRR